MANMNALVNYQNEIYNRIVKAQINFLKSPEERITQQYVEGKLELLEQMWFEVFKSDYIQNDVYDMTEEVYFEYRVALKTVLGQLISEITVPVASASSNCVTNSSKVKLPKVNIPNFSGNYCEWYTFRDLFKSLINNNRNLDNVQKLLYLKSFLCGEAEQLLSTIPILEDNYPRCWKILEDRYSNKKYICHHILKSLFSQRNIVSESASSLKELLDTTNNCLSALKNIAIDTSSWDVLIIHILTQKLDMESRRQWEFHASDKNVSHELPTYEQFCSFLTNRYKAMEFLDPKLSFNETVKDTHVSINKITSMHVTNIVSCKFCSKKHTLDCCGKFKRESVDSRRKFVLSNRICFCCLGSNHSAKCCQANVPYTLRVRVRQRFIQL
ncbi:hypothetical protein ABMA28_013294 [Loxostege sticticalis]|uniref:Uncharacterized protein n=1 Tax=Loxostege sticticalis TaxID=481309 RepID=A0ABD0THT4_LOXSC